MGSPTSRRKDTILVWPGQPTGSDRLTHFWTAIADILQRLCDGAHGPKAPHTIVGEDDIAVLCRPCREIYLEDRLCGLRVLEFSLDPLSLTNGVGTPNNGVATPNNGVAYTNTPEAMLCQEYPCLLSRDSTLPGELGNWLWFGVPGCSLSAQTLRAEASTAPSGNSWVRTTGGPVTPVTWRMVRWIGSWRARRTTRSRTTETSSTTTSSSGIAAMLSSSWWRSTITISGA